MLCYATLMLVIPYVQLPPFHLFGIPIQPFGMLVGIAVVVGWLLARRRARVAGLDPQVTSDALVWMLAGGFVMAHVVDVVFYYPEQILKNPLVLLTIWTDISSFGGFLGGALAVWLYCRRVGEPLLPYSDAIVFGLVPAWIFGRMGCTIAHDHPGRATTFVLGMRFPDGVVRHDLGFEELLFTVALTAILYSLRKVRPFDGFHTGLVLALYAPVRFLLDFLRIDDKTYLGLTPAQYFCFGMAALGAYLLASGPHRATVPPEQPSGT